MNLDPCGAADSPQVGVFSAEGLPPLPRGLIGVLSSSGGPWRDGDGVRSQAGNGRDDADTTHTPSKLGGLSLLQREMVDLRQLDTSLLCQLWSLHQDIQEYKNSSLLSEALFAADAGYSDEEEEDEVEEDEEKRVISQCPASSLSFSLLPPSSNSRDQWIKDSLNVP